MASDLLNLQNKIKRDPAGYREEFNQQWRHFQSALKIFELKPSDDANSFGNLIAFISQVSPCYKEETVEFPKLVMGLLEEHYLIMEPKLRMTLCQALILLRNRGMLTPMYLLPLFFKMFRAQDKTLRTMLYSHIVQDVRRMNQKHKDNKLNKTLQNFMFTMLQDDNLTAASMSLKVMVELYRRMVWNDAKTVNVIATACLRKESKLFIPAMRFFLGGDSALVDDEEDLVTKQDMYNAFDKKGTQKDKKKQKLLKGRLKKQNKRKAQETEPVFPAIQLVHDPQGFTEKIFRNLRQSNERFEVKIMMIDLISRLIGSHELVILNFYPFIQRYLQPHQKEVAKIMACLAQGCHELVPPEDLEPVVRTIVDNFVSDRCTNEAMCVGLNTVREMCARQPLALDEALLNDLTQMKSSRDKGVVAAARSLIQLYRVVNPAMLVKKDRGKDGQMNLEERKGMKYGERRVMSGVEGAGLLEGNEGEEGEDGVNEVEANGWEVASESDSESSGWIDVSEDDDRGVLDIEMSDSDSEGKKKKRKRDGDDEEDENSSDSESEDEGDKEENGESALPLEATRILTPMDFERIKKLQADKAAEKAHGKKRKAEVAKTAMAQAANVRAVTQDAVIDAGDLESSRKRQKRKLEDRLKTVHEGREAVREERKEKNDSARKGGTTNREKKKNNPFSMVKQKRSVKAKEKRSIKEKGRAKTLAMKKRSKSNGHKLKFSRKA